MQAPSMELAISEIERYRNEGESWADASNLVVELAKDHYYMGDGSSDFLYDAQFTLGE